MPLPASMKRRLRLPCADVRRRCRKFGSRAVARFPDESLTFAALRCRDCWLLPCVRPSSDRRIVTRLINPSERMIPASFVCQDCRTAGTLSPRNCCRSQSLQTELRQRRSFPRYYPGVTDQSGASLIEVKAGGTRAGIDFSIFEAPTAFCIRHCRRREETVPIKGAVVMFSRARQLLGHLAVRDH